MKHTSEVRDELLARAVDYPQDALQQCDEYIAERTRAVESLVTVAEVEGRDLKASEARAVEELSEHLSALRRLRETLDRKVLSAMKAENPQRYDYVTKMRSGELGHVLQPDGTYRSPNRVAATNHRTGNPARDAALRNIESRSVRVADEVRESLTKMVDSVARSGVEGEDTLTAIAAAADPDYAHAWRKMLLHGETAAPMFWSDGERHAFARAAQVHERAALLSGTATGNYLTPAFLDPTLVFTGTGAANPLRLVATVKRITAPVYKAVTSTQVAASYDSEGSEVSDDTPTLAQPTATLFRGSAYIGTSFEFLQDAEGDWLGEMAQLFADARDFLEASKIAYNGNGTSEPNGFWLSLTSVTNSRVTSTTAATLTLNDAFALQNALPPRFSANARWFASIAVINKLRALCMAQTGAGIWQDVASGTPALFLGRPIHELSTAPTTTTTGDYPLVYADPSRFHIVDHAVSGIEYVPNLFSTTNGRPIGQRGWFAVWRSGAVQTDPDSGRVLKVA